ncbi:fungal-specific transcription factor domain-containing protein [Dactylonectria estremocensis]|uniref:Fungal-specific transcription factor domain-containing protein n=1 Tax=Dactylonectria estremocensis TaxID=1079267 RepID=A0A9P9F9V6_9HYPO|nr:fungal-specific transcription factor domain-containing protein [Dactylonectria estremocensis]
MSSTPVRACVRCHGRKVKCSGYPGCSGCNCAGVQCEPYRRTKKSESIEALRQATIRVRWLEDQIHHNWGIECKRLPTGTPLQDVGHSPNDPGAPLQLSGLDVSPQLIETPADPSPANDAPEISLVALNATGDMRYLGPSSGAFFAAYATSIARSFTSEDSWRHPFSHRHIEQGSSDKVGVVGDERATLSSTDVQLLLRSYEMWIHPLYPLLYLDTLRNIIEKCSGLQVAGNTGSNQHTEQNTDMTIFYLVMSLGAINQDNTIRQLQMRPEIGSAHRRVPQSRSPAYLYSRALHHFDCNVQHLESSISAIQIVLLISIYSSYGSIGSSRWQLAGLAMRMATEIGLHCSPTVRHASEKERDERSRVFWTAYAIEISLAYNLGRPPSIGEEHITAGLPVITSETSLAVLYVKHRQIQSKIVSQVYCGNNAAWHLGADQKQHLISGLQTELDEWRTNITASQSEAGDAYPYSYWDRLYHATSFVLHRSSPLCPHPSPQSLEKCIRSAGAYIDAMATVLRRSNVPLSWMLVQGVLFAGLTMLVTARKGFRQLASWAGLPFLLVDFPGWTRKCSICLAIMNERWREDLLSKLEAQFEVLANDSLHIISLGLTSQPTIVPSHQGSDLIQLPDFVAGPAHLNDTLVDQSMEQPSRASDDWEHFNLDIFREFMGLDTVQTFWDMLPADMPSDGSQQINPW